MEEDTEYWEGRRDREETAIGDRGGKREGKREEIRPEGVRQLG